MRHTSLVTVCTPHALSTSKKIRIEVGGWIIPIHVDANFVLYLQQLLKKTLPDNRISSQELSQPFVEYLTQAKEETLVTALVEVTVMGW